VDQSTGADLSYVFSQFSTALLITRPHLYVQSDEERAAEERRSFAAAATGSNSTPLIHVEEQRKGTTAKRMSSPERFEIKQLIASGAVSAADVGYLLL
jgi:ATP-dependent RNA helicase DHX8/PRP22